MEDAVEVIHEESCFIEKKVWTLRHKWTLENFKTLEEIKSCPLSSGLEDFQDEWFIIIVPSYSKMRVGLCLEKLTGRASISANFKYSILGPDNVKKFVSSTSATRRYEEGSKFDFTDIDLVSYESIFEKAHHFLSRGSLTMLFDIQILIDRPVKEFLFTSNIHKCQLANDLSLALENENFGDVTFKVGEKSFKAIKGILAARSPVLAKMFEHETMEENKKNQVNISDISEEVFQELLHFIYTDSSPNIESMPIGLLVAAEKYQLERLKNWCEEILIKNTTAENVIGIFSFADTNNATNLKENSIRFIKHNLKAVARTEEYRIMKISQSKLLVEILDGMANISFEP